MILKRRSHRGVVVAETLPQQTTETEPRSRIKQRTQEHGDEAAAPEEEEEAPRGGGGSNQQPQVVGIVNSGSDNGAHRKVLQSGAVC